MNEILENVNELISFMYLTIIGEQDKLKLINNIYK